MEAHAFLWKTENIENHCSVVFTLQIGERDPRRAMEEFVFFMLTFCFC